MEQEQISRDLDYPRGLALALANQASVHHSGNNVSRALRLTDSAYAIAKEQGYTNLQGKIQSMHEEIRDGTEE